MYSKNKNRGLIVCYCVDRLSLSKIKGFLYSNPLIFDAKPLDTAISQLLRFSLSIHIFILFD